LPLLAGKPAKFTCQNHKAFDLMLDI
jgi:hypothetical protein